MAQGMSEPASGSANRGNPEIGRDAVEVVLVCAEADRRRILDVVPVLERESMQVRLLAGVEETVDTFQVDLFRRPGGTVFVVCMSPSLQGEALRRVVETFSGRPSVHSRLIVVEVDLRKVFGLVLSVRRAATVLRRQIELGPTPDSGVHRVCEVGTIPANIGLPPGGERRPHLRVVDEPLEEPSASTTAHSCERSSTTMVEGSIAAVSEVAQVLPVPSRPRVRGAIRMLISGGLIAFAAFALFDARGNGSESAALAMPPEVLPARRSPVIPLAPATSSATQGEDAKIDVSDAEDLVLLERVAAGALLRSEDLVVVLHEGEPTDWWTAANRCKVTNVGGVEGWRLPKTYELRELRRNRLLSDGTFWSLSRVSRADEPSNWVMDGPSGTMAAASKTHLAGSVCLRRLES